MTLLFLTGCLRTEGTIELQGRVVDEFTKEGIPNRKVIVKGILSKNSELIPIEACQFHTDSLGHFNCKMEKVKGAYSYTFTFVGDSMYSATTKEIFLNDLDPNSKYLSFSLNQFTNLTFQIVKVSKAPINEVFYFSWKSDGANGKTIFPYQIINYGNPPEYEFKWVGNNVNSIIRTKAIAGKEVIISCEILKGKVKKEIVDTILCKRNQDNRFTFKY